MNKKKSPGSGMLPGDLSFILNRFPFCFEPVIRKDYSSLFNWKSLRRNTKLLLRNFSRTILFSASSSGVP